MNELLEPPATGPQVPHLPRLPACLTRRADGEVIVTGTRVRAVDVFAAVASGVHLDDLSEAFPQVRPDRLAGVVAFRAAHLEAVDAYSRWRSERTGPTRARGPIRPSTASKPNGASDPDSGALAFAGLSNGMTGPPTASVAPAGLPATAAPAAHTPPAAPAAPASTPADLRAPAEPVDPRHPDPVE